MKALSAEFVTSAAAGGAVEGVLRDGVPQIALAGRSNVGKSSLINALCRRTVARTSAAPGKTRLANVYRVTLDGGGGPGRWELYLVDLPGYGYARGGADSATELKAVAEAYFASRGSGPGALGSGKRLRPERGAGLPAVAPGPPSPRLRRAAFAKQGAKAGGKRREAPPPSESERGCPPPLVAESAGDQQRRGLAGARTPRKRAEAEGPASIEKSGPSAEAIRQPIAALLLVDARHPGLESDVAAARWLDSLGIEHRVVATKIDKLSRSERARNLKTLERSFGTAALPVSAASGEGLDHLWTTIATLARNP